MRSHPWIVLVCASSCLAQAFVSPVQATSSEGSTSATIPFANGTARRYMQMHNDLPSVALPVAKLSFRQNAGDTVNFTGTRAIDLELWLGSSAVKFDAPSTSFAANYTLPPTLAIARKVVNFGPQGVNVTAGPAPFAGMDLVLDQTFVHNGPLTFVWEAVVYANTGTGTFNSLDADQSSLVAATITQTGLGCIASGKTLRMVQGLLCYDVAGTLLYAPGLANAPAGATAALALGTKNPNTPVVGLCSSLLTDLAVVIPLRAGRERVDRRGRWLRLRAAEHARGRIGVLAGPRRGRRQDRSVEGLQQRRLPDRVSAAGHDQAPAGHAALQHDRRDDRDQGDVHGRHVRRVRVRRARAVEPVIRGRVNGQGAGRLHGDAPGCALALVLHGHAAAALLVAAVLARALVVAFLAAALVLAGVLALARVMLEEIEATLDDFNERILDVVEPNIAPTPTQTSTAPTTGSPTASVAPSASTPSGTVAPPPSPSSEPTASTDPTTSADTTTGNTTSTDPTTSGDNTAVATTPDGSTSTDPTTSSGTTTDGSTSTDSTSSGTTSGASSTDGTTSDGSTSGGTASP